MYVAPFNSQAWHRVRAVCRDEYQMGFKVRLPENPG